MIHFFCPIQAFSVIEVTIQDSLASVISVGAVKFFGVRRNFARILPNLPEKYFKISDLQKKAFHVNSGSMRSPKKCSSCHFGRHFCSDFLGVLECSQRFSPDFMGFCRIFSKSKFLGVRLHPQQPRLLHQWLQWLAPRTDTSNHSGRIRFPFSIKASHIRCWSFWSAVAQPEASHTRIGIVRSMLEF